VKLAIFALIFGPSRSRSRRTATRHDLSPSRTTREQYESGIIKAIFQSALLLLQVVRLPSGEETTGGESSTVHGSCSLLPEINLLLDTSIGATLLPDERSRIQWWVHPQQQVQWFRLVLFGVGKERKHLAVRDAVSAISSGVFYNKSIY